MTVMMNETMNFDITINTLSQRRLRCSDFQFTFDCLYFPVKGMVLKRSSAVPIIIDADSTWHKKYSNNLEPQQILLLRVNIK